MAALELTVVIPIRNEAPSLVELHREFTETLTAWGRPYEIIVIDDGSTDESFDILARLQAGDPRLRVIKVDIPRHQFTIGCHDHSVWLLLIARHREPSETWGSADADYIVRFHAASTAASAPTRARASAP